MSTLTVFEFDGQKVRTVEIGGEPWFVAAKAGLPMFDSAPLFKVVITTLILLRLLAPAIPAPGL